MNKRIAVFGAAGAIGKPVAYALRDQGHAVHAYTRMHHEEQRATFARCGIVADRALDVDVREQVESLAAHLTDEQIRFDGIVYTVGHCPPGGILEYRVPLSQVPPLRLREEFAEHAQGVFNVYQCLLPLVCDGGCFVFVSSAITGNRSTDMPPRLHAETYMGGAGVEESAGRRYASRSCCVRTQD